MGTIKVRVECKFSEVSDPTHAPSLLHKERQSKSETVQVYAERLYTL